MAQQVVLQKQRHFTERVPAGNYSGITWLGGNRYAVADDKSPSAGFHLMTIDIDSINGQLLRVTADSFMTSGEKNRDEEGICYVPQSNTLFISSEANGKIIEYDMHGLPTRRQLNIPEIFRNTYSNAGFEALTYNAKTHLFWTTTENSLKPDGLQPSIKNRVSNRLRLQSFGDDLEPRHQYWYITDTTATTRTEGRSFLGVSGLAALDDGRIVVLERELFFPSGKIGSFAHVKLYVVRPSLHQPGDTLEKQLLTQFRTRINLTARSFANYEGICVGPRLADGSMVLVLVCDSQNQYRGMLYDWFRTVVIKNDE